MGSYSLRKRRRIRLKNYEKGDEGVSAREEDKSNFRTSVSRQNCIDRGCEDWKEGVNKDICSILHPKEGAIAGVHNRISNLMWKGLVIISTLVTAFFVFYTWDTNSMKTVQHEVNAVQDVAIKRHDEFIEKMYVKQDDMYRLLLSHNDTAPRMPSKALREYRQAPEMSHEGVDKITRQGK
jgi:hypothetical protein